MLDGSLVIPKTDPLNCPKRSSFRRTDVGDIARRFCPSTSLTKGFFPSLLYLWRAVSYCIFPSGPAAMVSPESVLVVETLGVVGLVWWMVHSAFLANTRTRGQEHEAFAHFVSSVVSVPSGQMISRGTLALRAIRMVIHVPERSSSAYPEGVAIIRSTELTMP